MLTMAYSENQDEMPLDAAFHPILQCLPIRQNDSSEKEIKKKLKL